MTRAYHEAFTKGNKNFVLYFGSHRCQYCLELEPLLLNYIQKTKAELYYIDLYSQEYGNNRDYYIETTNVTGAPNILIYRDGKMIYRERGANNLKTQVDVNTFFKKHIRTANLFTTDNKETIKPTVNKYVTFSYNFNNATHHELINKYFFPYFENKSYVNYLYDSLNNLETPLLTYDDNKNGISLPNNPEELEVIVKAYKTYFA